MQLRLLWDTLRIWFSFLLCTWGKGWYIPSRMLAAEV